jgi:heme/copper-type cytochrome/quinol oxidase subunit 2
MGRGYVPAAAVLGAVLLFWTAALLGHLSFLSAPRPPLATLVWLIFVYFSIAVTPIMGGLAIADLVRRWRGTRRKR